MAKRKSTMADVQRAHEAWEKHRANQEAIGAECCMVVVGYVSGRAPFMLLGRVSADTGFETMPDPPLTSHDMQPVALAAKLAFAKVLSQRKGKRMMKLKGLLGSGKGKG